LMKKDITMACFHSVEKEYKAHDKSVEVR